MKNKIISLELLFSFLIIVVTLSIIMFIFMQIKTEIQIINMNSEASLIASNILENINTRNFENIQKYIDDFYGKGVSKKLGDKLQNIIIYGDEFSEKFFGTAIPNGYTVDFSLENNSEFDVLKTVKIIVTFKNRDKTDKFELSTILEREKIKECNKPVLLESYFTSLVPNDIKDYSIIPIKYSRNNNCFVVTTKDDPEWYNYSSKKWAKVLILPKDNDLEKAFIDEYDKINEEINIDGKKHDIKEYLYVWIPNFSIKSGISYFRYGTGKKAIKMSFLYSKNKYLYLNVVSEEIKDISEKCSFDGIYGVWKKINDIDDEYYKNFNKTRFAPINLY